ncbi:hypothetical protein OJ996_25125 [Luteolibacter sp. GHJ8]|uniref:YXWGXW repeat-containing protein n=1 Tax=Luteolibacter rhizosphaerae TaxID=2989719 RepID=A0ABT3GAM7_9BACT|nr:hypothetical protein [Luteolibacter rhizosphaerae]MCW1916896.1 hypothetical protein [Luteolibacter rhizosphaerae]
MNSTRYGLLATITAFSACGALLTPIVATAQDEQVSEETEVLTRGPVHEAFAEAVSFEPEPGILISTQPPEVIDELPPEQELEGDNVTWIPGYWAWDEDSSDFLWISGIWRNIPPDREWVPGYWNEVGSEYQWVSGYWSDTGTEEVTYLPAPPRSLEAGPNVAAESDNDVWIPGTWMWADTRYRWRPGYYQPYREDWTYVPDRYSWTPRGYVYVNGYWDYTVPRRGVIFAPVRFHHHVYRRPNFYYSPVTVISLNLFVDHLFVRPRYNHYYFGDYYEPSYRDRGFFYNVNYARMRGGYDPIFAHRRWEHRHDRDWERNRLADFDFFRDNRDARPPRTWANLRDIGDGRRGFKGRDGKDFALATPLAQFVKNPGADAGDAGGKGRGRMNFKKLDGGAREKIVNQRKQMVDFTKQRKQIEKEAPVGKAVEGEAAPKPVKAKLNRSPIMGRKAAQMGDQAPPKRKQAPAVADKDPVADGTPQPGDNKPGQPGRPGRGGQGQGGGKGKQGQMTDDKTTTPDQPGRPGRGGQGGGGKGKGGNAGDDTTTTPDQPGRPGRGGQGGGGKGKQGQMTDDNKPAPAPKKEEATPAPKREPKPQPEKVQPPKRQPQPERQVQPKKQPQPERQVQPKKQPQPERQVQPKKQAQPQPERQVQPKKQAQPERQVQPKKQPQAQPQRQQPQREAQPQRAQPKREAQPQRQQPQRQPQRPQGGGGEGGGKGKNKEKDN